MQKHLLGRVRATFTMIRGGLVASNPISPGGRRMAAVAAAILWIAGTNASGQTSVTLTVPATSDPFLAGQPAGATTHGDTAPAESPARAMIAICGGAILHFTNATGLTSYYPGNVTNPPEGDTNYIASTSSDLGISGVTSPTCGLLGVFLSDGTNTGGLAPPDLNFSSASLRDFATLAPLLDQLFYVGDGFRNDLATVQDFVVPAGATRLYLGILDGYGWYNNPGSFTVTVTVVSAPAVCAGSSILGPGCGAAVLDLSSTTPVSGSTVTVSLASNLANTVGALGFTAPIGGSVSLGSGCLLYLDPGTLNTLGFVTDPAGVWSLSAGLPAPPGLAGLQLALQAALVDAAAPLGVSLSNGLLLTIGA